MSSAQRALASMPTRRVLIPCQTGEAYQLELDDAEIRMLLERRDLPFTVTPMGKVRLIRPSRHDERARQR